MTPKPYRLHKTKEIEKVFKSGRGFFGPFFQVKSLKTTSGFSRFTVVVSTKVDKRAVRRNRFKRVLREMIVKDLPRLTPADYIFTVKPAAKNLYPDNIRPEFQKFIERIK